MALRNLPTPIVAGPLLVAGALALELVGRWVGLPGGGLPGPWLGLLLAGRLLGGREAIPGVVVAAAAGMLLHDGGQAWGADVAIALACAAATEVAARALATREGEPGFLDQPAGVARFVAWACLLAPALVAPVAAGLLRPAGEPFLALAGRWFVALAFAQAVLAPSILAMAADGREALARLRRVPLEGVAIAVASAAVCWAILTRNLPVQPVLFGLAVWLELRLRAGGSYPVVTLYFLFLGYATAHGVGPFAALPPVQSLPAFELRVAFLFPVFMVLHAALAQNDRHLAALQGQNEELRALSMLEAGYAQKLESEVAARTDEARRARAEAEAANQAKSQFLARMSHEIRTPITALKGFAELMGDPVVDDARRLRYAEVMRRNSEHLGVLIDDILDLTRIEAGKLLVERVAFPLPPLLADLEALLGERARGQGLTFELRLQGPVPAEVETDPTRLRQVLLNLAGNAVKFTERGGVVIEAGMAGPACLEVRVTDTGIGISKEQLERLFRPFEQGDSSMTRRFGGAGLGLVISHALVEAMGGELAVRSVPRAGSTFTLRLPVGVPAGTPMVSAPPVPAAPPRVVLAGKVLLAEDGPDNQLLFQALLEAAGLDFTLVENGRAAVDAALAASQDLDPFDVVLMDMQMPVMDGYTATRTLREAGYRGPILAVTAHAMAGEHERCLAVGCDGYMSKPIDRRTFLETVARYLPAPPAALELGDLELDDLVAMFRGTLAGRVEAIAAAAAQADLATVQRLSHQLRGAAGSYGFAAITQAAEAVNQAASKPAAAPELAARIEELAGRCRQALEEGP